MSKRIRRRSRLAWVFRGFVLAVIGAGGTAAWHFDVVPTEPVIRILARIGIMKGAHPDDANSGDAQAGGGIPNAPTEPAFDPAAFRGPDSTSSDPALQTPPPSSAADWYNEATPTLAAAPPEHALGSPPAAPPSTIAAAAAEPVAAASPDNNPFAGLPPANAIAAAQNANRVPVPEPPSADVIHPAEFDPAKPVGGNVTPAANGAAPGPIAAADARLEAIDQHIAAGEVLQAHRELSTLYWNDESIRDVLRDRIETTARSIYFESQPHYMEPYVVQPGDQLRRIAERYKITWEYLAKLNQTDPRRIRPEQRLKVIKGPFAALIDLSDFELTIHAHGYYVRRYRIGVGKDNSSPTGTFIVQNKVVNPQYTDPDGKVVPADDPSNPLGERWIDLGSSYGIHGTIEPDSIGQAMSRGCIRMQNSDAEEVFDLLVQGSQIVIQR